MPRFLVALLRFSHSHSHSLRITLRVSGFTQAFSVLEHSLFTSKGKSTGIVGIIYNGPVLKPIRTLVASLL